MITGSCLCGAVAFEIDGGLSPLQYCHATRCRKASGSAFAAELAANTSAFRWIRGRDLLTEYEAPLLREPPPYRRAFCRVCGSPMPIPLQGTDFVVVQAGVLDGNAEPRPFRHIFVSQAPRWHTITDTLPRFEERPPAGERLPRTID